MIKFTLYTDSTMNANHVREHLITKFDGFTEYESKGTWQGETQSGVVFEVVTEWLNLEYFKELSKHLAIEFNQAVVLFTTQKVETHWIKGGEYDLPTL